MIEMGPAFYWVLVYAMVVAGFAWHAYLCRDLREKGWLRYRVNRLRTGALLFGAGVLINTITWGLQQEYAAAGWEYAAAAMREGALDSRIFSRGFMVIGSLLMVFGFTDSKRDALVCASGALLVLVLTLLWHAVR